MYPFEAESVAYAVCQHYGLDTSDYSFGYVAGWSSDKELSELKASLETIRATANDLITKIDGHLAQLQQEREARQEQAPTIWNGLDGLINDKPFMPGATPEQQANALIDFAERDGQRLGNGEIQAVGPTSFELVIVGIRDDEQAPAALRERAAALMDTIDRYKELNNTFSIYQVRGGPETQCSFAKKPQNNFKLSAKKEERLNGKINRLSALTF